MKKTAQTTTSTMRSWPKSILCATKLLPSHHFASFPLNKASFTGGLPLIKLIQKHGASLTPFATPILPVFSLSTIVTFAPHLPTISPKSQSMIRPGGIQSGRSSRKISAPVFHHSRWSTARKKWPLITRKLRLVWSMSTQLWLVLRLPFANFFVFFACSDCSE